jgi:phosphatidylinositol kinase/protein kinase (PI-3  family)
MGHLLWGIISLLDHMLFVIEKFRQVFKRVEKQLPQLTTLDLQYVSPSLLKARNLELAVPGVYFFSNTSLSHYKYCV